MRIALVATSVAALLALGGCGGPPAGPAPEPATGWYWAWLDSPGGPLGFGLELERGDAGYAAHLVNGAERIPVARAEWDGRELALHLDPYDATLRARTSHEGLRLDGAWSKVAGPDERAGLDFHAVRQDTRPWIELSTLADASPLAGSWSVKFGRDEDPAVARFEPLSGGGVRGTFLTTLGDYRFLDGYVHQGELTLSCFDGAHAFLFRARRDERGVLQGRFWSRDSWTDSWTGEREPDAALPDPFELSSWTAESGALGALAFPDVDGVARTLDDPELVGAARLLVLFGTWCPNCNDEAAYLAELDRRYRARGLSILGLAFELTGDFERDAQQVRAFARHHGLEFPILVAGTADKARASAAFPLLDRVRAYPTTVFLDAAGRARAVHTGYAGPATGDDHRAQREAFERLIEELLAE